MFCSTVSVGCCALLLCWKEAVFAAPSLRFQLSHSADFVLIPPTNQTLLCLAYSVWTRTASVSVVAKITSSLHKPIQKRRKKITKIAKNKRELRKNDGFIVWYTVKYNVLYYNTTKPQPQSCKGFMGLCLFEVYIQQETKQRKSLKLCKTSTVNAKAGSPEELIQLCGNVWGHILWWKYLCLCLPVSAGEGLVTGTVFLVFGIWLQVTVPPSTLCAACGKYYKSHGDYLSSLYSGPTAPPCRYPFLLLIHKMLSRKST